MLTAVSVAWSDREAMDTETVVTETDIADGLRCLGLSPESTVQVHSSLKSFGRVEGGTATVCRALIGTGATVMMVAGTGDLTALPAPPWSDRTIGIQSAASTAGSAILPAAIGLLIAPFGPDIIAPALLVLVAVNLVLVGYATYDRQGEALHR